MTRARSIVLVGLLAVLSAASLSAPASADTYTFGSTLPPPSPGYYDSCSDDCTTAQIDLPGAQVTAPVSGTVVRFRLRTGAGSDPHKIKFRILRSAGGEKFIGVGTSKAFDIPTTAAITTFDVHMPIKQGDIIGIDEPGGGKRANVIAVNNGAFQGGFFPALEDYSKARPSGNPRGSSPTVFELLLQAEMESEPADCTNNKQVATCADAEGQPSMCTAKTADYPQCSMAGDLPSACSGIGTGLPVCSLPGNHIVACGGFGLSLPVCNLPPNEVPGVCGPVTLGFQPCTVSNNQVQACGPVSLGLPQCQFKTAIPGRAPIEPTAGEWEGDVKLSCPPYVLEPSEADCRVYVAIAPLIDAKRNALGINATRIAEYYRYGVNYVPKSKWGEFIKQDAEYNANLYLDNRAGLLLDPVFFPYRRKVPLSPLTPAEKSYIFDYIWHPYGSRGPPELWQNEWTKFGAKWFADAMDGAIDELVAIAKSKGRGASARALARASAQAGTRPARAAFKGRFKIKRKAKRIHIELSKKGVRRLTKRLPKKEKVALVRLVVAFKAEPRPIVRYVDFGLKIKR